MVPELVIRALAFIVLRLIVLCCAVFCPLMPSLAIGVGYLCELGMDQLRLPPTPGPSTDLRAAYPVVS